MKTLSILLSCFTIAATLTVVCAYGADTTDCKNITQNPDNKAVPCDTSKGACPSAPAAPAAGTQQKAS